MRQNLLMAGADSVELMISLNVISMFMQGGGLNREIVSQNNTGKNHLTLTLVADIIAGKFTSYL